MNECVMTPQHYMTWMFELVHIKLAKSYLLFIYLVS